MDRNSEMRFAVKVSPGEDTGFPGGYLPTPRSPADITSQVARSTAGPVVPHFWCARGMINTVITISLSSSRTCLKVLI